MNEYIWPKFSNDSHIGVFSTYDNNEEWYKFLQNLYHVFQKLIKDAYWPSLAEHLGDGSEKIKHMADKIYTKCSCIPKEEFTLHCDDLAAIINEASDLFGRGLTVMAWIGDSKEWERRGLKPICRFCPIKNQKV